MSQKHYDEGGTSGCLGNEPALLLLLQQPELCQLLKSEVTAPPPSSSPIEGASRLPTWGGFRCSLSLCGGGGGPSLSPSRGALLGSWPRGCCWGRPWSPSSLCGGRTARGGWRGSPPLCWSTLGLVQGRGKGEFNTATVKS